MVIPVVSTAGAMICLDSIVFGLAALGLRTHSLSGHGREINAAGVLAGHDLLRYSDVPRQSKRCQLVLSLTSLLDVLLGRFSE